MAIEYKELPHQERARIQTIQNTPAFESQPWHLKKNQGILDQPPYTQLLDIIPAGFIAEDSGILTLLKRLASYRVNRHQGPLPQTLNMLKAQGNHESFRSWLRLITPQWKPHAYPVCRNIDAFLSTYPQAHAYLLDKGPLFDARTGSPLDPDVAPEISFAAYQHLHLKAKVALAKGTMSESHTRPPLVPGFPALDTAKR